MIKKSKTIQEALQQVGDPGPPLTVTPVGGGSISEAYKVGTAQGIYFLKYKAGAPSNFYTMEKQGLDALRQGYSRVPRVLALDTNWILMEWIEPGMIKERTATTLGHGLAQLHRTTAPSFGLAEDNVIGELPQPNGWLDSWVDFYREKRLQVQGEIAHRRGRLHGKRASRFHQLLDRLDRWLDDPSLSPALLHGDLWSGNFITDQAGDPWLIDPAVYFGHREVDLAFTELFGGFPSSFYAAYQEAFPLSEDYDNRKPLYQLYYLLVHLNLFGEAYGLRVDQILKRYVG